MGIQFRNDIITHVPTECLIEDYQTLVQAVQEENWDLVRCVKECIASVIDSYTMVPDGLDIKPSPSSVIAPGCRDGIMVSDNADILCAAGKPISFALSGGVCQCSDKCMATHDCAPEACYIKMDQGLTYKPTMQKPSEFVEDILGEA